MQSAEAVALRGSKIAISGRFGAPASAGAFCYRGRVGAKRVDSHAVGEPRSSWRRLTRRSAPFAR